MSHPTATSPPPTLRRDQWIVTVSALVWIGGTLLGAGVIGPGVEDQAGGLFSDSTTLIAPAGPAFSIWSVIYLGLAAYVVWQWLPAASRSVWAARTRLPAAGAIALNGLWLLVVRADLVWLSVVVMIGIVVSLGLVLRNTAGLEREGVAADLLVSLTYGLYLGWICVATCANIASWLVGLGVPADSPTSDWITLGVIVVVILVVAALLWRAGHLLFRLGIAAAVTWGLAWVAAGRLDGELLSQTVGYAAAVAAVVVAVLGVLAMLRGPSWSASPAGATGTPGRA